MTSDSERKISSLRDLPKDIPPPRDLWQSIEARIAAEQSGSLGGRVESGMRIGRTTRLQVWAAAAVIAALAVGIWIGRAVLPGPAQPPGASSAGNTSSAAGHNSATNSGWRAEYVMDSRYLHQRAELVQGLQARLNALPPDSRAKVIASLKTISDSKHELEAALGKDPSNALLQELLVNTYQDEMRVLTAVHEAGSSGEGI
jgi:hypothetical protein